MRTRAQAMTDPADSTDLTDLTDPTDLQSANASPQL
jgi:hypothetical protein